MAKKVTWRDDAENLCVLTIADGSTADTELTPGDEPFVTSMDTSDDIFLPVRTCTGNIRLLIDDVDDIVEMVGRTPISTPVTLTVNGTLRWVGFLSCESFSQEWDRGPIYVELPVMSGLETLKGLHYPYEALEDIGYISFAEFLCKMNAALGDIYTTFYFPNISETDTTLTYIFRMNNYATADDKNTSYEIDTYFDILEDICKLFGWQAIEWEDRLVFMAADVKDVVNGSNVKGYTAADMQGIANGQTVTPSTPTFSVVVPEFYGVDHRRSFVAGKNAVDVVGQIDEMDEDVWSMDVVEQCVYKGHDFYGVSLESYDIKNMASYQSEDSATPNGNILARNSLTSQLVDVEHGYNIKFLNYKNNAGAYGGCATYERFYKYNSEHERTAGDADFVARIITKGVDTSLMEAVRINTNFYYTPTQNGTDRFYIKGKVLFASAADDVFETVNGTKYTRTVMNIGEYYFNGSQWVTTPASMVLVIKDGEIQGYGYEVGSSFTWRSYIPAPNSVSGEVCLVLVATILDASDHGPGDEYVAYEDLKIQLKASTNKRSGVYIERRDIRGDVNENKVRLNNGFSEDWSQTCGLTLAREDIQDANGIVLTSMRGTPSSLYDSKYPEAALCDRVATYAAQAREVLFAIVKGDGHILSPLHNYAVEAGREMVVLCQSMNWRNNEVTAGFFEPSYNNE